MTCEPLSARITSVWFSKAPSREARGRQRGNGTPSAPPPTRRSSNTRVTSLQNPGCTVSHAGRRLNPLSCDVTVVADPRPPAALILWHASVSPPAYKMYFPGKTSETQPNKAVNSFCPPPGCSRKAGFLSRSDSELSWRRKNNLSVGEERQICRAASDAGVCPRSLDFSS